MNKPRILLAGIGGYGANYLREFLDAKDPQFVFSAVADPFAQSSPRFNELKERGIQAFKTPDEFFAAGGKAELTVIAAPIHTHYPYTAACFKNGSSVLCEKPVTGDLARLDDLIKLEKNSGLFCAVGFQACFAHDSRELKKDILAGLFGKPVAFKSHNLTRRGDQYYGRNNWAGKLRIDGETILDSPLNNGCSHDLQLMLFLLGNKINCSVEINSAEIELWQGRPDIENFDAAALKIKTVTDVQVLYYTAHCVEITGTGAEGDFLFEKARITRSPESLASFKAVFNDGSTKTYAESSEENNRHTMEKFYDSLEALKTGVPPVCTLETVRTHLKCVEMAAKTPVRKAPEDKLATGINEKDGDRFYYIPGLSQAFFKGYAENKLPSETGFKV